MTPKDPLAAACMTVPTIAKTAAAIIAFLRPRVSAAHQAIKEPRKHPAWRVDTMLASRLAAPTLSALTVGRLNFLLRRLEAVVAEVAELKLTL